MANINDQLQSTVDNNDIVLFMKGTPIPRNAVFRIRRRRSCALSRSILRA